jgi:hypothetical protein
MEKSQRLTNKSGGEINSARMMNIEMFVTRELDVPKLGKNLSALRT